MSSVVSDQATPLNALTQVTPSLRANFRWTFAGNTIYAACQWGMLSVLAKAGNPTIVGQLALGLAITAPVFMFTNLQLRAVQATDARSEFDFADYFTLRMLASLTGLLTVVAVAWFLRYDLATRLVVILVGVSKTVESLSDIIAGLLQKFERLKQVAISFIIRGSLSVAAFGGTFWRTHRLPAAVLALVLAWSAVFVFYDLRRALAVLNPGERFLRLRPEHLRRLAVVSAPLGAVMALISLNVNIPRYILVKYLGEADLGIFASMAYMLVAVNLIINALGQSATARLSRMFVVGDISSFRRIIAKLVQLGAGILVGGPILAAFLGRPLLAFLYRPEYARNITLFTVMAVTTGVSAIGSFLGYGMTAARCFRLQVPVIGISTLTTASLSLLLVPRVGLIGAAIALLTSALACVAGSVWVLHRALALQPRRGGGQIDSRI